MGRPIKLALSLLVGLGCTAGCTWPDRPDLRDAEPVDALDSALSAEDFDATVRALTALPYLPWGYTPDGCYARALYYSMLLATKGVPTNDLYVVARPGTMLGGQWSWHVAPLVTKDKDPNHLFVLDPVYDQTRALTNLEWVAKQNYTDTTLASYPSLHVQPGSSYQIPYTVDHPLANPGNPVAADYKEPTFEAMPSFKMTDVTAACLRMHQYIELEPNATPAQRAEKHRNLGRETQKIVRGLVARGKVAGDPASLPTQCTRNESIDGGASPIDDPSGDVDHEAFVEPTRVVPAN